MGSNIIHDKPKPTSSSTTTPSSSTSTPSSSSSWGEIERETDPLLRDLSEKKHHFRRSVVSLAAELKEVRSRLALQEQSFSSQTLITQEAEAKEKETVEKVFELRRSLEENDQQLETLSSCDQKYLKELDDLRTQLTVTKATADASVVSAQSAVALIDDLEEKDQSIPDHEDCVKRLAEHLDEFQKNLEARESSHEHLKDVLRVEYDIMKAMAKAGVNEDFCELYKMLEEFSSKNFERMNTILCVNDEEIAKLRDEIRILSAHWKLKTTELETQLEKHLKADKELQKRVSKLRLSVQEVRSQTRKLQRMDDRRDKDIKEIKDHLGMKQQSGKKQNFFGSLQFKMLASMSMLVLVTFVNR